jgi:hypothetical protein
MTSHQDYMRALQSFQAQRIQRDHRELAAESQYLRIATFFSEEMYGPRNTSARNAQARRMHQLARVVPGLAIRDVEPALQLLELTEQLDISVVEQLMVLAAPIDFDEELYEQAYRLADNYDARMAQLDLVRKALLNVHRMARNPLLGAAFQRTKGIAQTLGMGDIHRFLHVGYQSIQPVRNIERFVVAVYDHEKRRLDRIYDVCEDAPGEGVRG